MDTSAMMHPDDLPFDVTPNLREDILALKEAWEREDMNIDLYLDAVESSGREVKEEYDMRIRRYYVRGGWMIGEVI